MARPQSASPARRIEDELLRRGEEAELRREIERRRIEGASPHRPETDSHTLYVASPPC
jgi:hypothetical protein